MNLGTLVIQSNGTERVPAELVRELDGIFSDTPGVDTVSLAALLLRAAGNVMTETADPPPHRVLKASGYRTGVVAVEYPSADPVPEGGLGGRTRTPAPPPAPQTISERADDLDELVIRYRKLLAFPELEVLAGAANALRGAAIAPPAEPPRGINAIMVERDNLRTLRDKLTAALRDISERADRALGKPAGDPVRDALNNQAEAYAGNFLAEAERNAARGDNGYAEIWRAAAKRIRTLVIKGK